MRLTFDVIQKGWQSFAGSSRGRRLLKGARIVFTVGIVAFLAWKLRDDDLAQVVSGLPLKPHFYALLLVVYFVLPASQVLAYRITWTFRLRHSIPAFIKKRILNKDVLGYTGEVFLYSWATRHVDEPAVELMKTIRDQNILSSAASTMVAIILVTVFIFTGQVTLSDLVGDRQQGTIIAGTIALAIVLVILVRVWKFVFAMPWRSASMVFSVHVARIFLRQVAEITMWHVAMPEVLLKVWFTYAAAFIFASRIPFIQPDLLTVVIAVALATKLGVSEAHILALFGAVVVVHRGISLLFIMALPALKRRGGAVRESSV